MLEAMRKAKKSPAANHCRKRPAGDAQLLGLVGRENAVLLKRKRVDLVVGVGRRHRTNVYIR